MPWSTPTLAEQRQRARAFFAGRFPAAAALLQSQRPSTLGVVADAAAGLSQGELEYLRWQVNAVLMPDTCEGPYLLRRAKSYGLTPLPPVGASGPVLVGGNIGANLPAGSLVSSDSNAVFFTVVGVVIPPDGSSQAVAVLAQQGSAGSAGNLPAGTTLGLVTAAPGINATVSVQVPGLTGGVDTESEDSFRARYLSRIRRPPEGGAAADYTTWVQQAGIGATRIFVLPLNRGPGTCDVAFMLDARANPIPTPADVAAVQSYIAKPRPVTGDCVVFAPIPDPFAVVIRSLTISSGSTLAVVQTSINTAVADMLLRDATVPNAYGVTNPGVERLSRLVAAIQGAPGVVYFELVSPTADVFHGNGHIAVAAPATFQ
jgi:uncharacterized phage protein gp47/JayE